MKCCSLLILLLACGCMSFAQTDTVLHRYRRYLLAQLATDISPILANYDSIRQWPDINYADRYLAGWNVADHLRRVRNLSIAWSDPRSSWYQDSACRRVIHHALHHWLEKRYQSPNWWHNKIGVPQLMRDIIVMLRGSLDKEELSQALAVMAQNDEASWRKSTGANLVWCADLTFHYGAFTGDTALMRSCMEMIWKEMRITTKEGVQPDYSFHQHKERLQMYHYGRAFLQDNVRLAWETQGTPWTFPQEKIAILSSFILNGWQWMARGIYTVPGTLDRSVSRPNTLKGADIRPLIAYLCELDPANKTAYLAIEARQNGAGEPLTGFRHYPRSDFTVYHHPQFSFFLKTLSSRTLPAESINSENLKGHLMHSGDGYFILNGNEYTNLMPAWDWEHLPGTTEGAFTRNAFTGGITDGRSGFTVMDFGEGNKLWACYDNMMICLIAGRPGITTLDQCRLQGDVVTDTRWVYHNKLAYIPLEPSVINVQVAEQEGSWQSINAAGSPEIVREKVFKPSLQNASGYVVAYCDNVRQVRRLAEKKRWKVLRNTPECQALQLEDGTVMAAFYKAGNVAGISVEKPCLVMMKGDVKHVVDPTQTH